MMTNLMGTAAAVIALGAGLPATTAVPPAAQHSGPTIVAFNHWRGSHWHGHYIATVRPAVLGPKFGEPISSLHWRYWNRQAGAKGRGLLVHMSCQPCHATVVLSHAKLRPGGHGYFFNWLTVTYREFSGAYRARWSFRVGDWVSR